MDKLNYKFGGYGSPTKPDARLKRALAHFKDEYNAEPTEIYVHPTNVETYKAITDIPVKSDGVLKNEIQLPIPETD